MSTVVWIRLEIDGEPGAPSASAGTGRLVDAVRKIGAHVVAVEVRADLLAIVKAATKHNDDFLACTPDDLGQFDRVVMNPPFADGADIAHIKHAVGMLKPGGRLVALYANGPRQQAALRPLGRYTPLPAGSFKSEGTSVNVAMLVVSA